MTQRGKALLAIGLTLGGILLVLLLTSQFILLKSFVSLEEQKSLKNVERAAHVLDDVIDQINTIVGDYSGWDDAYKFVKDRNQEFVKTNLADAIYPKLRLNLLIYTDSAGRIVYGRAYDYLKDKPLPLYKSFLPHIAPASLLVRHDNPESVHTGIVMLPEGPLLVASRPVLTSEYKGPIRGALIMGRFLDAEETRRVSEIIRLPIGFSRLDAPALPPELAVVRSALSDASSSLVQRKNRDVIYGYHLFSDIYGKQALLARLDMPRDISRKGGETIRYFILWFFALSLVVFICSYIFVNRFILARLKKEETEKRYRMLVEQAAEGIILADPVNLTIMEANNAFRQLLGYAEENMLPQTLRDLLGEDWGVLDVHVKRALAERRPIKFELSLLATDHSIAYTEVSVAVISYEGHELLSFVVHDITERKRFEQELMYQASHDSLTDLPNRNILLDRLSQALSLGKRFNKPIGVLLLDLDNFKIINDTMGHAAGDRLLVNVAERLRGAMRRYDTVARLGGDEFAIILTEFGESKEVVPVTEKLLQLFSDPFETEGREIFITVSIGITLFPSDGDSAEVLLKNADAAVYNAKEQGKNSYRFFSAELNQKAFERLEMEGKLRHALERHEFELHYQPRVELATGRIVGAEALIRWNDPENGMIGPYKFIPLLEETGLIIPVGDWVMRTAGAQLKRWLEAGFPPLQISVNLSARQFHQLDLVGDVRRMLEETGLDPRYLGLEITESILMHDVEDVVAKLAALKDMGMSLSIDDFGTGYSSLSYLKRFPLDELKIDQSFVRDLTTDPDDAAIVTTIIAMAHSLKLKVVAEGVETLGQLAFLIEHQCEEMQGYYFSKPLPVGQFEELLKSGRQLPVEYDKLLFGQSGRDDKGSE
ncbi:MAG: EAL domain-containing protein [Geobacter sp.]|nr:EAL domain-containing protein [Geobacter sp.]